MYSALCTLHTAMWKSTVLLQNKKITIKKFRETNASLIKKR